MISRVAISKGGNRLDAVNKALNLLGGMPRFVRKNDTVFIKPNLMAGFGMGCNTHPDLIRMIVHKCLKAGAKKVYVGETAMSQIIGEKAFGWTRIREYLEKYGATFVNLEESEYQEVEFDGILSKKIRLPKELIESDIYINMPRMKTHCITKYTGAIKNSLGLLLDEDKRINHSFKRLDVKLLDIVKARKPDLTIVDSFFAMEGEGPGFGDPVTTGLGIVGNDIIATDAVCCRLMGIDPLAVKSIEYADKLRDGSINPRVIGEKIEDHVQQFKVPTQEIKDFPPIKHYIADDPCGCPSVMRIANTFLATFNRLFPYLFRTSNKKINVVAGNYKGEMRLCDVTILMGDCACANYGGRGEKVIRVKKNCGMKYRGEESDIKCPITDSWLSFLEALANEMGGPFELEVVKSFLEIARK